jgi:DNA-binding response OmpR family regulator
MRVFIADDEHQYRSHIGKALKRRGHEVESAETGREAIAKALLFRPDVLVADWMFRDQLHGVHVATALRSVFPRVKTVLISGFASDDLSADASRAGIDCFLEKPFELDQITDAVERGSVRADKPEAAGFALVEVDKKGRLVYINDFAAELFDRQIGAGRVPVDVVGLFGPDGAEIVEKAGLVWTEVQPPLAPSSRWTLRAREIEDMTVVVLISEEYRDLHSHPVLKNLMDIQTSSGVAWPRTDRVIVVDDSSAVRRMYHQSLERVGCISYRSGSHEMTIKLLREDMVDYDMPGIDTRFLVDEMRSIRPDLKIVGNSGVDHREDFREMGVDLYLAKPWSISDLVEVLES